MASEAVWYYARGQERVGPLTLDQLISALPGAGGERALIYGPNTSTWIEARHIPEIMSRMHHAGAYGTPPPPPTGRRSDEIDYEIFGEEMQYVEITLDRGETMIAEAGGMMYMTPGIRMESVFGDPSQQGKQGFFGKVLTAGKRMLTGESLFMTTFTNDAPDR